MDPVTHEQFGEKLRLTLERMREGGWVQSYTLNGHMPEKIVWTDKGQARLAVLREFSRQLGLVREPGIARVACWLAEQFGPDIEKL